MENKLENSNNTPNGELLIYQAEDGKTRVECRYLDDSLWLSQSLMAELFGVGVPTINEHLANIYDDGELNPEATIRNFRIVRLEGAREVSRLKRARLAVAKGAANNDRH